MMEIETIEKIEQKINFLQTMNILLMKKSIKFLIYLLIQGIIFSILVFALFRVYDGVGFEKTLIILIVMIFLTQVREQYKRA